MRNVIKYSILTLAGAAILGVTDPAPSYSQQLTATSWGGAYSMSQRKAYYEPFTAEFGITVLEDEWDGSMSKVRAMVDTGNYVTHVIDAEKSDVVEGCDEGTLETIDYSRIGGKDKFIPGAALECGVGTITWSTIYAYDGDAFPEGGLRPTTIGDLFDTDKFPGPRALYRNPDPLLEWALMADGVPMDQIFSTLETEAGIDRAFAKLDEIKPHVKVWWTAGAQPPQLLADKEVVIASAWNGRIFNAVKNEGKNFVIVWDGQILDMDYWIIPRGHPELDLAYKFLEYASRPEVMGNQSKYISYGPTVYDAVPLIDPAILADLPTAPNNTKNYLNANFQFWADRGEELEERFEAWLIK
jgi:putative spermidine/putrescine transport system substrate-binding protein